MEEAKKGSLWELGSYRRWDVWIPPATHPPPTRSIFEMRMGRRIVLTITPIYKTHTSLNVGKDNFVVACLCPRQNVDPEVSRPNRAIAAQKCNKKCDARAFILCFSLLFFVLSLPLPSWLHCVSQSFTVVVIEKRSVTSRYHGSTISGWRRNQRRRRRQGERQFLLPWQRDVTTFPPFETTNFAKKKQKQKYITKNNNND